jgi:hypothetical protein
MRSIAPTTAFMTRWICSSNAAERFVALVARKVDGSKARRSPGRPRVKREVEQLIVRMAKENRDWGYDRIAGALANLGYEVLTIAVRPQTQSTTAAANRRIPCRHVVGRPSTFFRLAFIMSRGRGLRFRSTSPSRPSEAALV